MIMTICATPPHYMKEPLPWMRLHCFAALHRATMTELRSIEANMTLPFCLMDPASARGEPEDAENAPT